MWVKYYQLLTQIKDLIGDFFSFWAIRIYIFFLVLLNGLLWLIAFRAVSASGKELVILHYNVDFGVNLIGEADKILVIPLLGVLVILINFFLSLAIYQNNKFLSHFLLSAALMVNFLLLAGLIVIYFVNFHTWF